MYSLPKQGIKLVVFKGILYIIVELHYVKSFIARKRGNVIYQKCLINIYGNENVLITERHRKAQWQSGNKMK